MADRYWVGGTDAWDGTAGTKWADSLSGAGGASVPTTADTVWFTGTVFNAGAFGTVTISAGNTGAGSIQCSGFTGTITGTDAITVAGSITLIATSSWTHTGTVTITGTGTLTTAGKSFSSLTVNGVGITVTLGDALSTAPRSIVITSGTFNTANYNVTTGVFFSTNSNLRTINFGSSTVTISGAAGLSFTIPTNLTFNAGTSLIVMANQNNAQFIGGGQTFYNVSFTSTLVGTRLISGANTYNNLTLIASGIGLNQLTIDSNQTVNGTLTCAGDSVATRGFVRSDTIGTTRTITANAISANDCDFRDITLAGAASGASPTRAGDCGGNSGITFPAAKTVYWNAAGVQLWGTNVWALTSNGTPAVNNFPLAQDTATFTDSGSVGTAQTQVAFNIGTIDASSRTSAMLLNLGATNIIYGNFTLGSGISLPNNFGQTFAGRGTQTFTSAGITIPFPITVDKPAGAFELGNATTTTNTITHTRGTFDAKNYNLTCNRFDSNSTVTRTINMGSGLWTISGDTIVWRLGDTGLTFNKDTADILLTNTTTNGRTFSGNRSYNKLTIGGATGTSTLTVSGSNSFTELASTKTVAHTISFAVNQGTIGIWSVTGTVGNVVTVRSAIAGTRRNFTLTNVTSEIDYLSVTDIGITNADRFYVGTNSTDGGNNLNVYFGSPPGGQNSNFFLLY